MKYLENEISNSTPHKKTNKKKIERETQKQYNFKSINSKTPENCH